MADTTCSSELGFEAARVVPVNLGRTKAMALYFFLTYLAVLLNSLGFLQHVQLKGFLTIAFVAAVYLTYSLVYLLPVVALTGLVSLLGLLPGLRSVIHSRVRGFVIAAVAVAGTALLQILIFFDKFVFDLYGFHFNGFVWNLITTRGGIESMGAGTTSVGTFSMFMVFFVVVQVALFLIVLGLPRVNTLLTAMLRRRRVILLAVVLLVACGFERVTYGISSVCGYRPVLAASGAFPFYMPIRLSKLAKSLGYDSARQPSYDLGQQSLRTAYPRQPIHRDPPAHPLNLVWLVSESLRWDMLDPEIMPNSWKLSQEGLVCRQHYSGGNGTRMGMFSMFYGLHGCFWFPIFEEQRSPVLMDVLLQAGYQMEMFTSASFTYPEFDRTMFVNVPPSKLHEAQTALQWRRDQENVSDLLEFIDRRDTGKPFMTFMFFESPHAPYHFPKECIIRRPYEEDLNYATMDVHADMTPIKNRYINACNHLDLQVGRVLDHLRKQHLMESTIVIVTGDHGEEFMEKGRWGHNSEFTEEQTRPPLVIWAPGRGHREVTRLTSHIDIPATLMPMLGVTNPPSDYSLGLDLFGETAHDHAVICDWNHVAYIDERYKVVLPFNVYGFAEQKITTRDDRAVESPDRALDGNAARLTRFMADLKAFSM